MRLIIVTIDRRDAMLKNEDARRVSSFNFMNYVMSIHVEYVHVRVQRELLILYGYTTRRDNHDDAK